MRTHSRVLSLVAGFSLLAFAPAPLALTPSARAQCGVWDGALASPVGVDADVRALTTWDPDGLGPEPLRIVAAGRFTQAGANAVGGVASWDGLQWRPFGAGFADGLVPGVDPAITTWDPDGPGPQLPQVVVGGRFTTASGVPVNGIARWSGSAWLPFASGMAQGVGDTEVRALTTWDPDGPGPLNARLVAGGSFATAGGVTVNNVAVWDGAAWQPLASGMNGAVLALTTWDPDGTGPLFPQIVAGGTFTTAGGTAANRVARWDGSAWRALGTSGGGVSIIAGTASVRAMQTWDPDGPGPLPPDLIVGGVFDRAGTVNASRVARWNGTAWQALGAGLSASVEDLTTWDSDGPGPLGLDLIAAGTFAGTVDGQPRGVARWTGTAWQPIRASLFETSPLGYAVATWDPDGAGPLAPDLVVGGEFVTFGGNWANNVSRLRGIVWEGLGAPTFGEVSIPPSLLALGEWDPDGSGPAGAGLIAAGTFRRIGATAFNHIARWDGAAWQTLGTGIPTGRGGQNPRVEDITTWDADGPGPQAAQLVAVGLFTAAGTATTANGTARWDGTTWRAFGAGVSGGTLPSPLAVQTWDPDGPGPLLDQVVIGGTFTTAGTATANSIARWDGSGWRALAGGMTRASATPTVAALTTWDFDGAAGPLSAEVVAAGLFDAAGGVPAINIARWDGTQWRAMGSGLGGGAGGGQVSVLAHWDPDGPGPAPVQLIAGGTFLASGSTPVSCIARWDGAQWQALGSGITPLPGGGVTTLFTKVPSEFGPPQTQLIVAGEFTAAGGVAAQRVASWDGTTWRAFTSGRAGVVGDALQWDPDGAGPAAPQQLFADNVAGWGSRMAVWDTRPPEIVLQPASVAIEDGGDATLLLAVRNTASPVFRWRRNGVALQDGTTQSGSVLAGVATPALIISNAHPQDAGTYECAIISPCGRLASAPALVTITPAPGPCNYDFNQDENTDLIDAQQMAQVFVGLLVRQPGWLDGDLDGDENADLRDAQLLASFIVTGECGV